MLELNNKIQERIDVFKKIFLIIVLIIFLIIFLCDNVGFIYQITEKTLADLQQQMTNPEIMIIRDSEYKLNIFDTTPYFFVYDKDDLNKNPELLEGGKTKTVLLPLPAVKGENMHYAASNKYLICFNIVKSSDKDVLGIEIFDFDKRKWKKLKTMPQERLNSNNPPSFYFAARYKPYSDETFPILIIWGGDNIKTKKAQNSLEVINLSDDSYIKKTDYPINGGKIIQTKFGYTIYGGTRSGTSPLIAEFLPNGFINAVPFSTQKPILYSFFRCITKKHTDIREGAFAVNKDKNEIKFVGYDSDIDSDWNVKTIEFKYEPEFFNQDIVNVFSENTYVRQKFLFLFNKGGKQNLYELRFKKKVGKETNFMKKFVPIFFIEKDLPDIQNAIPTITEDYQYGLIKLENNSIKFIGLNIL